MRSKRKSALAIAAGAGVIMVAAACSSSQATSASGSNAHSVNVAGAESLIAPYVGQPSAFPTNDPLRKPPVPGTKVVFADVGTPTSALQWQLMQPAAKALGIDLIRIKAGSDASTVGPAFDTIVSMKPAGVVIIGIDPVLYATQLKELQQAGTTVVASAIEDGPQYGISPVSYGASDVELAGALMGAWTIARGKGVATDIALYNVPELAFSKPEILAAQAKIAEYCPACTTRIVNIPLAQIGTSAPQSIVGDLQAHPDTTAAVLATDELAAGLPAALREAGISLETVGSAPGPANLQQIQSGTESAGLGVDLNEQVWALLDQFARQHSHQPLSGPEARGQLVMQFLTKPDVTFNPSLGWTGYPQLATRFTKLWQGQSS
jgi:ribose transport system substrate-binding protein